MSLLLFALLAYLLGGVPLARLVERLLPERSWTPVAAFAADALKGALAVAFLSPVGPWGQALSATAVLAGHQWPLYGRDPTETGLRVAAGALTIVSPVALPFWLLLWALGFVVSGYRAIGSLVATVFFAPLLGYWAGWPIGIISLPTCYMVLDRLRPSLRRVLLGTEPRHVWHSGS